MSEGVPENGEECGALDVECFVGMFKDEECLNAVSAQGYRMLISQQNSKVR